jgi:hypothetical protein
MGIAGSCRWWWRKVIYSDSSSYKPKPPLDEYTKASEKPRSNSTHTYVIAVLATAGFLPGFRAVQQEGAVANCLPRA